MTIRNFKLNGAEYFHVYVNIRSKKNPRIRVQREQKLDSSGNAITSKTDADKIERNLIRLATEECVKRESAGSTWGDVIDQWETFKIKFPSANYSQSTVEDHVARLRKWTADWLHFVASEITRADGREMLLKVERLGKSHTFVKQLRSSINVIYTWGMEERLIPNVAKSPVDGVGITTSKEDKMPEILTESEIRKLLEKAKDADHPWYPVWALAVLMGARSGELQGLRREDCETISRELALEQDKRPEGSRDYGIIRLRRAWQSRISKVGPLKAKYWRNVAVNGELFWLLQELLNEDFGKDEFGSYLLPRLPGWEGGEQAMPLRQFCQEIGIPSVKFHTLRACFATQMMLKGVPSVTIMKIGGWKDLKTMERYVRLAGIEERGATDKLSFLPQAKVNNGKVVSLNDFIRRK